MTTETEENIRVRGIYLLPNLLTTCGLFAGFYSIVAAMKGLFELSAIAIFVAMIADGLDGRVARLTATESAFGAQYDSLSDMTSFGIAPALVTYSWTLSKLGKLGWLIAFVFAAAAALRLARFNSQGTDDKRYFRGLSSTASAGLVAAMVWMGHDMAVTGKMVSVAAGVIVFSTAMLMISRFPFYSFKELDLRGRVPSVALLVVLLGIVLITLDPPTMLFGALVIYALSGPLYWLVRLKRKAH